MFYRSNHVLVFQQMPLGLFIRRMAVSHTSWRWSNSGKFQVCAQEMVLCITSQQHLPHPKGMDDKYNEEVIHHESQGPWLHAQNIKLISHANALWWRQGHDIHQHEFESSAFKVNAIYMANLILVEGEYKFKHFLADACLLASISKHHRCSHSYQIKLSVSKLGLEKSK